jgi:hypothetical protein
MALLSSLSWSGLAAILSLSSILYAVGLVLYRLWLHPLAKLPGSLLARSTFWYEFYHTYFGQGTYYLRVNEMHIKYGMDQRFHSARKPNLYVGPVIRITPDELHVNDPAFYHTLFVSSAVRKTENYPRASDGTGFEGKIYESLLQSLLRSSLQI